jgi:hypothetical protein
MPAGRAAFCVYADCGGDARRLPRAARPGAVAATPGIDFSANGTDRCVRFASRPTGAPGRGALNPTLQ